MGFGHNLVVVGKLQTINKAGHHHKMKMQLELPTWRWSRSESEKHKDPRNQDPEEGFEK